MSILTLLKRERRVCVFGKKKDIFFVTLEQMADVVVKAADHFAESVSGPLPNMDDFVKEMENFEHEGDQHIHTILTALNKTFITPIDRDDIMELAKALDDVLDGIDACASRFDMYAIDKTDDYIRKFADNLRQSAGEIKAAISLLTQKKLLDMQPHCRVLHQLENQGDNLMREGIKNLFKNERDPIQLLKYKELYQRLEETTDACEDVATCLQSIIMRNS